MRKRIVGLVLAGGRVDELSVLTAQRPKSAVPIWGHYRIIDFVLSNMMRAGIEVVGVLSQYRPYSLMTHLARGEAWDFVGRSRELRILTPFVGTEDSDWYKGTADAIYQNLDFLQRFAPDLVLIASGDHVYSMDYRPLIAQHLATGAEATIALKPMPPDQTHLYGTAVLDGDRRVVRYDEKVAAAPGHLASLTIYVFKTDSLVARVRQNAEEGGSFQIYSEILPRMVAERAGVYGFVFDGYWQYARTLDSYYATSMDLLGARPPDLAAWNLRTNLSPDTLGDPPPTLFRPQARAAGAVVCPGARIEGTVERSIVSPGVVVEAGAVVRDSVVMHDCVIGARAVVDRAILDKGVTVGADARVGDGADAPNRAAPQILASGVTVVGKAAALPRGLRVGRGCILAPGLTEADLHTAEIPAGSTVPA